MKRKKTHTHTKTRSLRFTEIEVCFHAPHMPTTWTMKFSMIELADWSWKFDRSFRPIWMFDENSTALNVRHWTNLFLLTWALEPTKSDHVKEAGAAELVTREGDCFGRLPRCTRSLIGRCDCMILAWCLACYVWQQAS